MKRRSNPIRLHLQIPLPQAGEGARRAGEGVRVGLKWEKGCPSRAQFLRWIQAVISAAELTIRITDEAESAALNQKYRGKQGPTNILSFPAENPSDAKCPYLGDLVICAPLVMQEAQQQQKMALHHWAHLTVHGVLHLLGYDHVQEQEAEVMESLEISILDKLGIGNPYQ